MKLLCLILIFSFCLNTTLQAALCTPQDCLKQISKLDEFAQLASSTKIGSRTVQVVKVVIEKKLNNRITPYFINTKKYSFHYDFATQFLKERMELEEFNQNYILPFSQRDFILISLSLWPANENKSPRLLLEFWNGDKIEDRGVELVYNQINTMLPKNIELYYHPMGLGQEEFIKSNISIPVVTTAELYAGVDYVAMNEGEAIGRLTVVENEETCLDHTNIALYQRTPNDVGLVGGIITEEMQTPLGHINVKSMNRGTANMSLKNARTVLEPYIGKTVHLKVLGDKYEIETITEEDADQKIRQFWNKRRPHVHFDSNALILKENDGRFIDLQKYFNHRNIGPKGHRKALLSFGAKATNLGVLNFIESKNSSFNIDFFVPDAMAVPFNFYDQFMNLKQKGLDESQPERMTTPEELIRELLTKEGVFEQNKEISFCSIRPTLNKIRKIISKSEVPSSMLLLFKKYLLEEVSSPIHQQKITKLRLRSSTNSEDLVGFTGAGLYNSTGIWVYGKGKMDNGEEVRLSTLPLKWEKIEKDLKEQIPYIYSSVWNDRAFEEREWYGINKELHMKVKVGMALHDGVPFKGLDGVKNEMANGVAITDNIFNPEENYKLYINGQHFDLAVTNPPTEEELKERDPQAKIKNYKTEELLVSTMSPDPNKEMDLDFWPEWSYEVLSRSSVKNGTPVLLDDPNETSEQGQVEVRKLARVLRHLQKEFAGVYGKGPEFAMDIEWKIVGPQRKIWIKQARPFAKPQQASMMSTMLAAPSAMRLIGKVPTDNINMIPIGPKRP